MNRQVVSAALLFTSVAFPRNTQVRFDPTRPEAGPFPTDFLTVPDSQQRTGLRVNLPLPANCAATPSDCAETQAINQLDGFNPSGRITLQFSGPVNAETLRDSVYVAWLDPVPGRFPMYPAGKLSPVNQLIWDPSSNTATMKPDEMLEQSRSYLIIVTDGARDAAGDPLESSDGFRACLARELGGDYCARLSAEVARIEPVLGGSRRIVGASVFTTLSVTAFLEEARRIVQATPTQFRRTNASINLSNLATITQRFQARTAEGAATIDNLLPIPPGLIASSGVGSVAFGSYRSPQFASRETFVIAQTPTAEPLSVPPTQEEIFFHVWLPRTPAPPGGHPVIIAGHGITDSRLGMPTIIASANSVGFAVAAINAVGHGYGPGSGLRFGLSDGSSVDAAMPGRGVDLDRNGTIDATEGCTVLTPSFALALGDCLRQTAVDLMQLAHTLRDGVDFDGDGRPDLNGAGVSYIGQSLGGGYGTLFTALEPGLRSSVLNVAPGSLFEAGRTTESAGLRLLFLAQLGLLRQPSLLNDGPAGFVDEVPFRNEPVRVRSRAGAAALQDFYDRLEWLDATRAPQSYGPYLRTSTLPGVGVRPILFQMALGDTTVPNQTTSALIRAANMREFTSLYRSDTARSVSGDIPREVHTYLLPLGGTPVQAVSLAALAEAYQFVATGQLVNVNPLLRPLFGRDVFETPAVLPERPNFPPRQ